MKLTDIRTKATLIQHLRAGDHVIYMDRIRKVTSIRKTYHDGGRVVGFSGLDDTVVFTNTTALVQAYVR